MSFISPPDETDENARNLILLRNKDIGYASSDVNTHEQTIAQQLKNKSSQIEVLNEISFISPTDKTDENADNWIYLQNKKNNTHNQTIISQLKKNTISEKGIVHQTDKKVILFELVNKIERHAESFIVEDQTPAEKVVFLYKFEKRLHELIQYHGAIYRNTPKVNEYTDLLIQGLELSVRKLIKSNLRNLNVLTFGNDSEVATNSTPVENIMLSCNNSVSNITTLIKNNKFTPYQENMISKLAHKMKYFEKLYSKYSNTSERQNIESHIRDLLRNLTIERKSHELNEYIYIITRDVGQSLKNLIMSELRSMASIHVNGTTFAKNIPLDSNYKFAKSNVTATRSKNIHVGNNSLDDINPLLRNKTSADTIAAFSNIKSTGNSSHTSNCSAIEIFTLFSENIMDDSYVITATSNISSNDKITKPTLKNNFQSSDKSNITVGEILHYLGNIIDQASIDPVCDDKIKYVCDQIPSLQNIKCEDDQTISVTELCDGVPDCRDGSDEKNCSDKGNV